MQLKLTAVALLKSSSTDGVDNAEAVRHIAAGMIMTTLEVDCNLPILSLAIVTDYLHRSILMKTATANGLGSSAALGGSCIAFCMFLKLSAVTGQCYTTGPRTTAP